MARLTTPQNVVLLAKMKKAEAMSLNVIIVAILALLVLVVLALVFTGKIKVFGTGTRNCAGLGGGCEADGCEFNEAALPDTNCANYCCVDTFSSDQDNTN